MHNALSPLLAQLPSPRALRTFFIVWRAAPAQYYAGLEQSACPTGAVPALADLPDGSCVPHFMSSGGDGDPRDGARVFSTGSSLGDVGLAVAGGGATGRLHWAAVQGGIDGTDMSQAGGGGSLAPVADRVHVSCDTRRFRVWNATAASEISNVSARVARFGPASDGCGD